MSKILFSHLDFGLDLPAIALARLPRKALASGQAQARQAGLTFELCHLTFYSTFSLLFVHEEA